VEEYRNLEHEFIGDLSLDKGVTAILVIGEAARQDMLGIHGSELDTTPHLDRFAREKPDHLLLFNDAVAASSYTRVSVPSMLSVSSTRYHSEISKHPGILKILKSADRDTVLISNQLESGFYDSFITAFMEDATRRTYLMDSGHHYDEALIPLLVNELANPGETSRLIILHLAGSHYDYEAKYPPSEAFFQPNTFENHYLNSLRYTDLVLQGIFDTIMALDHPVFMLYSSDHGEYVNDYGDGFYDHGNRYILTRFEIDIPFLLAFNEPFLRDHSSEVSEISKRTDLGVSHDNISHTVLGLMGIYDSTYQPEFDLSSTGFVENPRFIVERNNKITLLENVQFDNTKFEGMGKDRN
jgi:lipid A ethanolaminephosphotransferase